MAMKAWVQTKYGKPEDVLEIKEVTKPKPQGRDLLVKVLGAALNPVDTKHSSGWGNADTPFTKTEPLIVGYDGSGVVEELGSEASLFKVGDEVYFAGAIGRQGCFAEYVAIDERIVGRKPKNLNFRDAAAIPLCALTVWEALVEGGHFTIPVEGQPNPNANKSILVIAGAGGVGSIAIQIAKKILKFGTVIASASRQDTIDFCKKLGADYTINHRNDWVEEIQKLGIGLNGVDVVNNNTEFSTNYEQTFKAVNPFGTITIITGASVPINFGPCFVKSIKVVYEIMFARSRTGIEAERQGKILNDFARWAEEGVIDPRAVNVFEWSKLPSGFTLQASGQAIGKIVFEVNF